MFVLSHSSANILSCSDDARVKTLGMFHIADFWTKYLIFWVHSGSKVGKNAAQSQPLYPSSWLNVYVVHSFTLEHFIHIVSFLLVLLPCHTCTGPRKSVCHMTHLVWLCVISVPQNPVEHGLAGACVSQRRRTPAGFTLRFLDQSTSRVNEKVTVWSWALKRI